MEKTGRNWEIYVLIDPRTSDVRYVGVSHMGIKRLRMHIAKAKRGAFGHKNNWIRILVAEGLVPGYRVIDVGDGESWMEREQYWIAFYRNDGVDLTNMTDGGEGALGRVLSAESREKIAVSKRGKSVVFSAEHKANLSKAGRGRVHSEKAKENYRLAGLKRRGISVNFSKEHKRRLSAAAIRRQKGYGEGQEKLFE